MRRWRSTSEIVSGSSIGIVGTHKAVGHLRASSRGLLFVRIFAPAQRVRSNPSIEGMPKRLRLLVTPHVKR